MAQWWDELPIEGDGEARWDAKAILRCRLPQAIALAESMYGPRDDAFTLLEVRFGGDVPRLEPVGAPEEKAVRLWLSRGTLTNATEYQAMHQLAHEVIHLLNPVRDKANVLEEGVATLFSSDFLSHIGCGKPAPETQPYYARAVALVSGLEATHPGAAKMLRMACGAWSAVTAGAILGLYPDTLPSAAAELVEFK